MLTPSTLSNSTKLSTETRFQQNPCMRPIVAFLYELHVIRMNMTAINEAGFIIVDCLQCKMFKVEKCFSDIVFKATGFLNLWPSTC